MKYTLSFTCGFLLELFSVSHLRQIDGCLQGYVNTVVYLMLVGSCLLVCTLSVTWGRLMDVCGVCVISSLFEAAWRCLQGVCNLLVIWGRLVVFCTGCIICQILVTRGWFSAGCVYSVTYMRQICDCLQGVCTLSVTWGSIGGCLLWCTLSLTWGRLASVCRGWGCTLSVIWSRLAVVYWGVLCHSHEADWRFSAWGRDVLCHLHEAGWRLSAWGGGVLCH